MAGVPAVILAAFATVDSTSCGTSEESIQRERVERERQRRMESGREVLGTRRGRMHHRVPA